MSTYIQSTVLLICCWVLLMISALISVSTTGSVKKLPYKHKHRNVV